MGIVYFVLGVITVLSIGSIVMAVKVMINLYKFKEQQKDLKNDFFQEIERINRNSDEVFEHTMRQNNEEFSNIYQKIDSVDDVIHRELDSRLDKLENKLINR